MIISGLLLGLVDLVTDIRIGYFLEHKRIRIRKESVCSLFYFILNHVYCLSHPGVSFM